MNESHQVRDSINFNRNEAQYIYIYILKIAIT